MIKILTIDDEGEWSEFLEMIKPDSRDIYFTPQYYKLYQNSGSGKACCFVFTDGNSVGLYPFLRNSINAIGYNLDSEYYDIQGAYGYNGIIASTDDQLFKNKMLKELGYYCINENIVAEFTRFHPLLRNFSGYEEYFSMVYDRQTVFFNLQSSLDEVFEKFQYSTKRQIRRAVNRFGMTTEIKNNGGDYTDEVYDLYCKTMDRVEAPGDLYFSHSFFNEMLSLKETVLFRALINGSLVAFIIGFGSNGYFHGHLSGSLREAIYMSPNSLLYWEMIKYAKEHGYKFLHIGGGDTAEAENSLLKFKMNFSKETAEFWIGKKIHNSEVYSNVIGQWKKKQRSSSGKVNENILLKYRY